MMSEIINPQTRVFVILLSVGVLIYVINLVRKKKMREEFALFWLAGSGLFFVAALSIDWLDQLARWMGVDYPPALFFMIAILAFLFLFFNYSVNISKLSEQNKSLIQDVALLNRRIEELEGAPPKAMDGVKPGEAV